MPNAGGLALLAGILEFLPCIGPAISGTIGTVLAYFQGSNWMPVGNLFFAVVVGIVYAIIGQLESVYFIPRFVGGRVKLHPAVTFVGIITGALTFGVLGILLAAPVIASARVLIVYISRKLMDREPFETEMATQSMLHIPGVIAGRKIEAVVFDLDGTLTQVDPRVVEWAASHLRWMDRVVPPEARRQSGVPHAARASRGRSISSRISSTAGAGARRRTDRPHARPAAGSAPRGRTGVAPRRARRLLRLGQLYRLALVTTRERARCYALPRAKRVERRTV